MSTISKQMRLGKNPFSNFVRVRPIRASDLVQRKRKNKVLRGVKHHVSEGVGPSGPGDVVPPDEETRDCGVWSTTSVPAEAHPDLGTWCFLRPGTLFSRNERSRCTKCTAASSIYYAFFGVARSKAKPASPGSALVRSANSGEAHAARQRLASPAAPCPRGEARTAYTSHGYIGRCGMCTVKVVPLPGMLST